MPMEAHLERQSQQRAIASKNSNSCPLKTKIHHPNIRPIHNCRKVSKSLKTYRFLDGPIVFEFPLTISRESPQSAGKKGRKSPTFHKKRLDTLFRCIKPVLSIW